MIIFAEDDYIINSKKSTKLLKKYIPFTNIKMYSNY